MLKSPRAGTNNNFVILISIYDGVFLLIDLLIQNQNK